MKANDEYFDSKEFQDMLEAYERSVKAGEPVFMDAEELSDIADFYQFTGQADEAEEAITLALSLAPGAIAPLTYRIHQALFEGDPQKAREYYDQIIETDDPDYVYDRAEILIAEGRVEEADQYLREQFKQVPPDEYQDYVMDVANIYTDNGQPGKAMEWMARARHQQSDDFKELMGRTLFELGKYKDSERIFNELVDKDPFSTKYWNALASAQYMSEDYQKAIQSSEYAIAINPEDPDGLIAKANGLVHLNNFEEALKYYKRYSEQIPNDEYGLLSQGICLLNINKPEEALEVLQKAAYIAQPDSPSLVDIYQELAFAYSENGMAQEAIDTLNKTNEMDCDHVQMEIIKGHVMLANGNLKRAESYFSNAINLSDDECSTWLRIILSFYDNHYTEAAYKLFKKYLHLCETNEEWKDKEPMRGYAYMALCCYELKYYGEFLEYLKKACEKTPEDCRQALSHLFPHDLKPQEYYDYIKNKIEGLKQ